MRLKVFKFYASYFSLLQVTTTALLLMTATAVIAKDEVTHYDRVSLVATASTEVDNDILEATLYVQREGSNAALLSDEVNSIIQWAIGQAKQANDVTLQTSGYQTNPIYRQQTLTAWRVRQSLRLQSGDITALSQLIGKLQGKLVVGRVGYRISAQRRNAVEEDLISEAIALFQQRAALVAKRMGRADYRVVRMNINASGTPVRPVQRAAVSNMAITSSAAPSFEAGTQTVKVSISGTVELLLN